MAACGTCMFHSPTSETKQQNNSTRAQAQQSPGFSARVPFGYAPIRGQLACLHSTYGNQMVLRQLSRAKTVNTESAPSHPVFAQLPPHGTPPSRVPSDGGHPLDASAPPAAAPRAMLTLSNHTSYDDTGNSSRKRVRFDVSIPPSQNIRDYVLVNKIKGVAVRNARGEPFTLMMDEIMVPYYFDNWRVDSPDHDPVFGSTNLNRWAGYTPTSTGFYYEDSPGPAHSSEPNSFYDLCFKTELHRSRDVPMEYSAPLPAPLEVRYWQYYVRVDAAGRYSHQRPHGEADRCAGT